MRALILLAFVSILSPAISHAQSCQQPIDVVFAMDSSGSIRTHGTDSQPYQLWFDQIEAVKHMVQSHDIATDKSHIALLNTGGCVGPESTYESCSDPESDTAYRLRIEHALSGNSETINARMIALGESDFVKGYSWWNETLRLAKSQFDLSERENARKVLVYMAEGEPTSGHQPCDHFGYVSEDLQALRDDGIEVLVVAMVAGDAADIAAQQCLTEDPDNKYVLMNDMSDYYGQLITNDNDDDDLCGDLDTCPFDPLNDIDGDGLCGEVDPDIADTDPDYIAPDMDDDNDGVADVSDSCPTGNIGNGLGHPYGDADGDGCDDREDADADNDGLLNDADGYPLISISGFADNDNDGIPDTCANLDCLGMAEDDDDDNDLVKDEDDAFPLDASESKDSDGDGIGDNQDDTPNGLDNAPAQGPETDPSEGQNNKSSGSGAITSMPFILYLIALIAIFRRRVRFS